MSSSNLIIGISLLSITCLANALYALITLVQNINVKDCDYTLMSAQAWLLVMSIEEFLVGGLLVLSLVLFLVLFSAFKRMIGIVLLVSVLFSAVWSLLALFVIIDRQSCYLNDLMSWNAVVIITCIATFRYIFIGCTFLLLNKCSCDRNIMYFYLVNEE